MNKISIIITQILIIILKEMNLLKFNKYLINVEMIIILINKFL
jgi:hypothetical protein